MCCWCFVIIGWYQQIHLDSLFLQKIVVMPILVVKVFSSGCMEFSITKYWRWVWSTNTTTRLVLKYDTKVITVARSGVLLVKSSILFFHLFVFYKELLFYLVAVISMECDKEFSSTFFFKVHIGRLAKAGSRVFTGLLDHFELNFFKKILFLLKNKYSITNF